MPKTPDKTITCPLCGSLVSEVFDQRSFRGYLVTNRLCKDCGLVFEAPRLSDAELATFYESEYRVVYQGQEGPAAKDLAVQRSRADVLLDFISAKVKAVSRHLDIGCSSGLLLERFQSAFHCRPVGIEPGKAYRQYAASHNLRVYASLEEFHEAGEAKVDLVSMAHVLEHLPDPVNYLAALRETVLCRGGWLLLEVPNLFGHDCFEVAHLVSFGPHTLRQTVQKAGYQVLRVQTHGRPRSRFAPLYVTLLAQPLPPEQVQQVYAVRPDTAVWTRRRLGLAFRRLIWRIKK